MERQVRETVCDRVEVYLKIGEAKKGGGVIGFQALEAHLDT